MKKATFESETALNMFPLDHSIIHSHSLDASRGKSLPHHLFSSKQQVIWVDSTTGRKENTWLQQMVDCSTWYELVPILAGRRRQQQLESEINVKTCHKSAKSFPLSLFQDFDLESGLLGGFCINSGSCISILWKGANNQNGNLRWIFPWRGGGLELEKWFFLKTI